MKVCIVEINTESCDHYTPLVLAKEPSDKELKKILKKKFPGEFEIAKDEPGPGIWDTYLHVKIHKDVEVI